MRKQKNKCVYGCGFLVGSGGDRHKKGRCPPKANPKSASSLKKIQKQLNKKRSKSTQRGMVVAGTGRQKQEEAQ